MIMRNTILTTARTTRTRIIRQMALFISFLILFAYNASAQDGGPSIGNLNKNLSAAKDQISRQEKMNYIFMALGFILVLGIAWFSTNVAKKRKIEQDELIRRRHLNNNVKHSTHDPYWKTHGSGSGAKVRK